MKCDHFFYNCSREYVDTVDSDLFDDIVGVISHLPKRDTQSDINKDLFWLLTIDKWSYDSTPSGTPEMPPRDLNIKDTSLKDIKKNNNHELCRSTTTLDAGWCADFAKKYPTGIVQLEAQFGKVESMFKDFCGFKIGRHEKRLALGIEVVLSNPNDYFAHRRNAVGGMVYFDIAKMTLPAIGLDCPIWLIGIKE